MNLGIAIRRATSGMNRASYRTAVKRPEKPSRGFPPLNVALADPAVRVPDTDSVSEKSPPASTMSMEPDIVPAPMVPVNVPEKSS
jgi:hypothetical protein